MKLRSRRVRRERQPSASSFAKRRSALATVLLILVGQSLLLATGCGGDNQKVTKPQNPAPPRHRRLR